jgi:citrate lyase subunit beta/citryl-CoA lyase
VSDTPVDLRPRRSVLYMPGANERALEKAKDIPADALILDLEDAVAPDAKPEARERVCAAVGGGGYGNRELAIRANGIGTPWHDADLKAIAAAGPAAVVVPKVNSAAEVLQLVSALEQAGAPDHTKLWAMLETPQAMLHAEEIAGASERLTVLVMGTTTSPRSCTRPASPGATRCCRGSASASSPPAPRGRCCSTASTTTSRTRPASSRSAGSGARWASTARP